ncbi:MAG TPA: leucine-rich repeat domain-containing protein [Candidatus Saccharimonadales bacterium]|nr:leucine-rich repeat domain-containing protein [Candidatus Saccharimonadales bacterium]
MNDDVLREIVSHADIRSVFRFCQVNKTLCHQQEFLFHKIYQHHYHQTGMDVFKNKTDTMTWFQLIKRCYLLEQLRMTLPILNTYSIKELYTVQILDLSHNRLNVLPPEIGQLSHLIYLNLSNNQLSALPPEIGQLRALQTLSLFNNQLSALPPEIGQLSFLQTLYLSNNQLSALPPEMGQMCDLQYLILSYNQLNALPPEMSRLIKLHTLIF